MISLLNKELGKATINMKKGPGTLRKKKNKNNEY